jgi:hypothetical protein
VQSTRLHVNDDVFNENDYLQTDIERVNVRDTRFWYLETYASTQCLVPEGTGTQLARLALKYFCIGKFPLQMELNRHTWQLSIYEATHVESMVGSTQEVELQCRP